MAEYALRTGTRFLHISAISVSGKSQADVFGSERAEKERWFGEEHLYQGQAVSNVHVRSKFKA